MTKTKHGSDDKKDACRLSSNLVNKGGGGGKGMRFFCVIK